MVFVAQLTLFYSTGITRYRDVSGSGAILKISNEAELDTPPRRLRASVTETWQLNARHARTPDEICPQGGKTHPTIKSAFTFIPLFRTLTLMVISCRWLYGLFIAMDANFRLKLKARGVADPELGSGLAYFVNAKKLTAHLQT